MKDFLIGALGGYSKAQEAENKSLLDNEISRRKGLVDIFLRESNNPANRPEAQEKYFQKAIGIQQTPAEKKLAKGMDTLDDIVMIAPQQGVSWPGAERQVPLMPSPSPKPEGVAPTAPPQQSMSAMMPAPPPGYQMPARLSFQEQLGRQRAVGEQQMEQEITTERGKARAQAEARRDFAIPEPPKPFSAAAGSMVIMPDGTKFMVPGRADSMTEGEMRRTTAYGLFGERNRLDPTKLTFEQKAQAEREFAEMQDINGEPLYPVVEGDNIVYKGRSRAEGASAPRTLYGAGGMPTTAGQAGLSTTPPPQVPESTQTQLAGWKVAYDSFSNLIPQLKANANSLGQLAGRVTMGKVELGGYGATPSQIRMMISLKQQIIQAFADGGKNLTGVEKEIFTDMNPKANETLQQAVIKAEMARDLAKTRYEARVGVMSPRQQGQVPRITGAPNAPPGGGTVRVLHPNGKVYDLPADQVPAAEARGGKRVP